MDKFYKKDDKTIITKIGEEYVVYPNPEAEKEATYVCMFDEFAKEIFEKLDGEKSTIEIITEIEEKYNAAHEIVEKDITEFLNNLLDAGLIYENRGK